MHVRLTMPLIITLAFAYGCSGSSNVEHLFGGSENLAVVNAATHVEAFRVSLQPAAGPTSQPWLKDAGWQLLSGPAVLNDNQRTRLRGILNDVNTYDFRMAKACMFHPDVAFRFTSGARDVSIVLCFTCDELMIRANGAATGVEDFDSQRPALLRLAKELFPYDVYVQQLGER